MFEVQPVVYSQVLRQAGRTLGTTAVGVTVEAELVEVTTTVEGAMTEVEVIKTVDREDVVSRLVTPPVVWVFVTGQTVVDVMTTTVVMLSAGEVVVPTGATELVVGAAGRVDVVVMRTVEREEVVSMLVVPAVV